MYIRDITKDLAERELPTVNEESTIEDVIEAMQKLPHSRLVYVVDDANKLLGTISLGMLVRHTLLHKFEPHIHPRKLLAMVTHETSKDIMLISPVTATDNDDVEDVIKRMIDANVKEIGVVDSEGRLIADITMLDLLKAMNDLE